MDHLHVCIMAGGSGERFWPLSRKATPKHLLRLFSDATMIELTVRRLEGLVPLERIYILTNEAQLAATREALPFIAEGNLIAEPAKRDTAPACALGTALIRSRDPSGIVALLPADALVHDAASFRRQLLEMAKLAQDYPSALFTFGIPPRYPATGFGYMELGTPLLDPEGLSATPSMPTASESVKPQELHTPSRSSFHHVKRFVEKPDLVTAQHYIDSKNYLWNAGMFVWSSEAFLKEAHRLQPTLAHFMEQLPAAAHQLAPYLRDHFPALEKISVDYAIMEKAEEVICCRAEYDWDDVGAWTALPAHLDTDAQGNTLRGPTALHDSHGNIIFAQKRTIALCGVSDHIIVETDDAILVCHKDRAQEVKSLQLKLSPSLQ